ncbi:hypothetical protein BY996DRAFT_6554417 [Phakopsora pachyrhizi]|nr:hypothetical protein BY996DRAFT_6554417 [Phakopsora pachyrhizi]
MEKGSQNSDGEEIERLAPRENLANSKKEIERMEADVSKLKKAQEMLCEVYKNNIGFLQVRNRQAGRNYAMCASKSNVCSMEFTHKMYGWVYSS